MNNARRDSPSFHRNIDPITQKLRTILFKNCRRILEIGSGSGQHVERLSKEFPDIQFQPTEYNPQILESIDSWCQTASNVLPAVQLDVTSQNWLEPNTSKFDALLCFNVVHITPWEVTQAIFQGAGHIMNDECQIMLYGPFKISGKQTSDSNTEFDNWLKEKDVSFGIRDIADLEEQADANRFELAYKHVMPANNFMLEFTRV